MPVGTSLQIACLYLQRDSGCGIPCCLDIRLYGCNETQAANLGHEESLASRILNGRTAVTMDLSIRLGEALALSPDFFSKAQLQYDLWIESQKKRRKIRPLAA